jgi:hypothetical protein
MKLGYKFLSVGGFGVIFMLISNSTNNIASAQFRGQDSQQFFDRGNQIMEQQIQQIEQNNRQNLEVNPEVKEIPLENSLEVKSPDKLDVKEVPDSAVELENNVPESPNEEIKIQQN